jgi:carbon-monoxide dehydrogenase medium subunit
MWNFYYTPSSLPEALALLERFGARARVVAGGTDLLLELARHQRPGVEGLIDVTRVPNVDRVTLDENDLIHLGPLVTHNQCVTAKLVLERALPLAQACWEVGAPQIRNRGTVAGNVITASPANDTITPLVALDAAVTLQSVRGTRVVPLREFYTGARKTVMRFDDVLTDIAFAALKTSERGVFLKLGLRLAQAISVINVAVILDFDPTSATEIGKQTILKARIALGAVAPTIVRAARAEDFLRGQTLTPAVIAQAATLAQWAAHPIDDVRSSAEYRLAMAQVLARRALEAIATGQERRALPEYPITLGPAPTLNPIASTQALGKDDPIVTRINKREYVIRGAHNKTLLRLLREEARLIGTKEGCAEGECGACTVWLDGAAVMACLVPAPRAHGAEIVTIEGLAQDEKLHPLHQAMIETGAVQCGYCTPGLVMAGAKLLEERPQPTRAECQQALTGNLCRCTGYYKIVEALEKAGRVAR